MRESSRQCRARKRLWTAFLSLGAIVALQSGPLAGASLADTSQVTIIHSNNLTGHVFACPT